MLRFLLDTNIVIYVIKSKPLSALKLFNEHAGHMAISSITLAELLHGAEKSIAPARSLAVVEDFCTRLEVLPYGTKAASTTRLFLRLRVLILSNTEASPRKKSG